MWYSHKVKYYSARESNNKMIPDIMKMNLKSVKLNKRVLHKRSYFVTLVNEYPEQTNPQNQKGDW